MLASRRSVIQYISATRWHQRNDRGHSTIFPTEGMDSDIFVGDLNAIAAWLSGLGNETNHQCWWDRSEVVDFRISDGAHIGLTAAYEPSSTEANSCKRHFWITCGNIPEYWHRVNLSTAKSNACGTYIPQLRSISSKRQKSLEIILNKRER